MQTTLCSRCGKNVAVIFITKIEAGQTKNEGLCLKCARELHIKPVDDMGVLILDEPTAGLDPSGSRKIMDNIRRYREQSGATVIIVSHNMDDAARLTERLIVFDHGHIAMDGTPEEVFSRPQELIDIGLNVPQATALAMALRERGMELPGAIFTHEQLLAAVKLAKGVAAC